VRRLGAVLFDLDDTLHDDTAAYRGAASRVAADVAKERGGDATAIVEAYVAQSNTFWSTLDTSRLGDAIGDVRAKMWSRALAAAGIEASEALGRDCGERYNAYRSGLLVLFPEALGLLDDLRGRGIALGMITNGFSETHRDKISQLRLDAVFDLVLIADEVGFVKPDPRVFVLAAERLGVPPARCAMVGDRYDRDIRTPLELGMFAVWTNVRGEPVPAGAPAPDADVPTLAGVAAALEPYLPPRPARDDAADSFAAGREA